MTPDKTPSEAELLPCPFCGEAAKHSFNSLYGDMSMASCKSCGATAYAPKWNRRAILAKWGSPVVATKVSIPTHTMEQEFQNHYRRGFEAGKKDGSPVVAGEPYAYAVYFPDQPCEELVHDLDDLTEDLTNREHTITKLYDTPQPTQAQAGAVPLTDEQIGSMACVYGLTNIEVPALQWLVREVEYLHGIKEGGQHAAD